MAQLLKGNVRIRCSLQNSSEKFIVLGHATSFTAFVKQSLTLPLTCRRPTAAFRVHSKPQAGDGQVERPVRGRHLDRWATLRFSPLLHQFPLIRAVKIV